MQHYRRKPFELTPLTAPQEVVERVIETVSSMQRALLPFPGSDQLLPHRSPTTLPVPQVVSNAGSDGIETQVGQVWDAAGLVPAAAGILDEEMAAGVLAARDASGRRGSDIPPPGYRSTLGNQPLLPDIYEILKAVAEMIPRLRDTFGSAPTAAHSASPNHEEEGTTLLRAREPVHPGQSAKVCFKVQNDAAQPVRFVAHCSDLVHASGERIPERQVEFEPSNIALTPDQSAEISVVVKVPLQSARGVFLGIVVASGLPYLRAVLEIEVL